MATTPADYDVQRNRISALEDIVRKLIQHLVKDGVMTEDLRREIVDSMIDSATGDPGSEDQAKRWSRDLLGSAG